MNKNLETEAIWQMGIGSVGIATAGFVIGLILNKAWWVIHVSNLVFNVAVYVALGSLILGFLFLFLRSLWMISVSYVLMLISTGLATRDAKKLDDAIEEDSGYPVVGQFEFEV